MQRHRLAVAALLAAATLFGAAQRQLKPGFNLLSKDHDIELGKGASQQVEKQVALVRDQPALTSYVSDLGNRLAKVSQAPEYPYTFKLVAEKGINAFALPGGPIYVHAATVAAADNEAQLAGVMAHEIAHVALRHSTHQMSKAYALQIPFLLAGAVLGSGSLLGQLTQLGIGFGFNSVLLKYSRDAERDADIVGARNVAAAGYDPVEMARFFEKLEAEQQKAGGGPPIQFLSDHPNPGNRVKSVQDEVKSMPRRSYSQGSDNFAQMRASAAKVPSADRRQGYNHEAGPNHPHPEMPSSEFREYRGNGFRLAYPANWKPYGETNGSSVTIAPQDGMVRDRSGQVQIVLGAIAGYFSPDTTSITAATDELIQDLRSKNPDMRPIRGQRQRIVVDGSNGETVLLAGSSPKGRELDSLLTATRPDGLFYLILVCPESDYNTLRPVFQRMQSAVRFR